MALKTGDLQTAVTLMERARELGVDRVVITGDLSNLALEQEFEQIVAKLDAIGVPPAPGE